MDVDKKYGPHGGSWIRTVDGFVELSVFETNVPPRFRIYFFNLSGNPVAPIPADRVTLDTLRPDGSQQSFVFKVAADFLEAAAMLPEPHEFDVSLNITYNNHTHQYQIQFTEANHEHEHGHEQHSHKHGSNTGILARVRGIFGHSHQIADKIDETMESNELGIRTLKITLLIFLVTATFQLCIALASGSVALLADSIHNFADASTSIPLWIAFALARRGVSKRFTYGYGKVEDVAGVVIVFIILASACLAAYESIIKIIHPVPMDNLGWVSAAAIIGFMGNEWVALYRIRVGKQIGSAALVADGYHARIDGYTSLAVLLGVAGTWFGYHFIDPLVGIIITITILFIVKDTAKAVWMRLIDGIEPEIISAIEHAPTHIEGVKSVQDIRARWIGHRVHADITIYVDPALSVQAADEISKRVEHALRVHVRLLSSVVVRVRS